MDNPIQEGWEGVVVTLDAVSGRLRVRTAEERTTASNAIEHNKFLIATPICVRLRPTLSLLARVVCDGINVCGLTRGTRILVLAHQVSLRAHTKPGRNGVHLKDTDFKHSRKMYASISKENHSSIWIECLNPGDPLVKNFASRDKQGYPDQFFLDPGDTMEEFNNRFNASVASREKLGKAVPLKVDAVGEIFPPLIEYEDILAHVLSGELRLASPAFHPSNASNPRGDA